jgi:hypothetical protein
MPRVNSKLKEGELRKQLRRLFRSMDFVSQHPALNKEDAEADRYAEIYQQLGMAWEYFALQCQHRSGWRSLRDGNQACKTCGLIRGAEEGWLLVPRNGRKTIGHRAVPNSKKVFPDKKSATVVNDIVDFYGAILHVETLNRHKATGRLFKNRDWQIAEDRLVRLREGPVEVQFSTHTIDVRMTKRVKGEMPPYTHFVWELPRKLLKKFPVMVQFGKRDEFKGVIIWRPQSRQKK